ncbi:hypothetical protein K8T06_07570 [bacterium]|nr:hypothetical protein [bacterium]
MINISSTKITIREAWDVTRNHFPPILHVYHPGMFRINGEFGKYPAISLTGRDCQLLCLHCNGQLLNSMSDGSSKEKFLAKCSAWDSKNLPGILVSGGSDSNGCLPWKKYIPLLKKIKSQTNLHVSIHIGLADPIIVKQLSETGIDTVMFDLVPTPEIYNRVFRLKNGYERMLLMIKELEKTSIQVAPHIILGLDHGKVFSEYPILDSISNLNISTLVIIQFMPLHGTPLFNKPTAKDDDIVDYIAASRLRFPSTEISLGCARKKPNSALEIRAVQAGITRLALPEQETINKAMQLGLSIEKHPMCCSVSGLSYPRNEEIIINDSEKPGLC